LQYRCGAKAANELDEHIAGRPVSCDGVGPDQYGRTVAVCSMSIPFRRAFLVARKFRWTEFKKLAMMIEAAKISSLGNDRQRIDRPDTRDLPQKMVIWAMS
jgi:hypothetical protein